MPRSTPLANPRSSGGNGRRAPSPSRRPPRACGRPATAGTHRSGARRVPAGRVGERTLHDVSPPGRRADVARADRAVHEVGGERAVTIVEVGVAPASSAARRARTAPSSMRTSASSATSRAVVTSRTSSVASGGRGSRRRSNHARALARRLRVALRASRACPSSVTRGCAETLLEFGVDAVDGGPRARRRRVVSSAVDHGDPQLFGRSRPSRARTPRP